MTWGKRYSTSNVCLEPLADVWRHAAHVTANHLASSVAGMKLAHMSRTSTHKNIMSSMGHNQATLMLDKSIPAAMEGVYCRPFAVGGARLMGASTNPAEPANNLQDKHCAVKCWGDQQTQGVMKQHSP